MATSSISAHHNLLRPHYTAAMAHALYVKAVQNITEISAADWNACANPSGRIEYNPFITHEFLRALEDSGSASGKTGWQPFHLVLMNQSEQVCAVAPLYVKSHSRGEYVFDSGWAEALHRAGGRYYPKLQGSVPFTPATGRRLLANPQRDVGDAEAHLLAGATQVAERLRASSVHFTFMPKGQWDAAGQAGYLLRMDQQFHWHNGGYANFDAFLGDLSAKKRKNLKRERRDALANGVSIEWLTGSDLREAHWDAFFRFYMDTGNRKWGSPYLTRAFFSLISATMAKDILLILCKRAGKYIAGALNFIGSDALYGRHWGCSEDHPFLHFETCYYQAIDFAIERKLSRVEAGAQGAHKVARGYLPMATYSAHWIADPGFRDAVDRYLRAERRQVESDIEWIEEHSPFKTGVDLAELRNVGKVALE